MKVRKPLIAAIISEVVVLAGVGAGLATGFVNVDNFPSFSTYGVSVGTDTNYCSAELVQGWPELTCQHVTDH